MSKSFEIRRLSGALGAEILGIDLVRDLDPAMTRQLRDIWLEHGVVFFRDQELSSPQFLDFARKWGDVIEYPLVKGLEGFPLIIPVVKLEHEKNNFGGIWHSDTAYLENPPMASMLVAREVPPFGGDTLFACQYAAYEALSAGMKQMLGGLTAINSSAKADVTKTREDRIAERGTETAKQTLQAEHPVVRTHPETGRKSLYVNFGHTLRFRDMSEEESAPLLKFLFAHQIQPEFTCRFTWRPGSVALWDNRCTQHNPVNDYHGYRRVMHRITLQGDRPR
jgi:taurine dioxygenase